MSSTDDDLKSLSASNRPPSRQESIVAGKCLQLSSQKLEVLDTRIAALEHELEELKAQRAIIEGETHRYADILSARRLLPPEIIAQFMELACVDAESESSQSSGTYRQVLSFMRVSREWYRTACGVARFWTELDVDLRNSSAQEIQEIILKAINRSARSSELPLSLKIAFSAVAPADARIVDFIQSLIPRVGLLNLRMQVESMAACDVEFFYSLFHHPRSPSSSSRVWPTLHTLQISIQSEDELVTDFELPFPSSNFPLLRTVAISSPNVTLTSYRMPWSNLLKLDLGLPPQVEDQKYVSILGECTNLRFLRIRTQSQIIGTGIPAVTLPHLTHLHVAGSDSGDTGRHLLLLHLPSLQSCIYTVAAPGMYYSSIVNRLARLIQRSGCSGSMEYLEIDLGRGTFYSPNDLRNLLLQVPRLAVLKLSGYKMGENALQEVPPTVRELSINLSYYRIDEARKMFVDYLYSRLASSGSSGSDDPVKAQLHIVDTIRTRAARKQLDLLQQQFGSSLEAIMD
jgi:uncharacterized small protein (DUF1192 family)